MTAQLRFGSYELDVAGMELRKNGVRVHLPDQPFRILATLVSKPGEVVTREELRSRIWEDGTFVDFDQSLNKAVNRLREVLNDDASRPRFIETVPRRGYRFVAHVTGPAPSAVEPPPAGLRPWTSPERHRPNRLLACAPGPHLSDTDPTACWLSVAAHWRSRAHSSSFCIPRTPSRSTWASHHGFSSPTRSLPNSHATANCWLTCQRDSETCRISGCGKSAARTQYREDTVRLVNVRDGYVGRSTLGVFQDDVVAVHRRC